MFQRLATLVKAMLNTLMGKMEDPEMMLEQTVTELQNNLIQVRQAVAQAIATEKQLETQLNKNKEQASTWHNRATMAVQQGNDDLARQALQRKQQFAQAAADLETQLKAQKEATAGLRARLQEMEGEVNKAQIKKQQLTARNKAAKATERANEMLSLASPDSAASTMERIEQKIQEKEAKAQALAELGADELDKKFKSFEGQVDIEAELLALKGTGGGPKLIMAADKVEADADTVDVDDIKPGQ